MKPMFEVPRVVQVQLVLDRPANDACLVVAARQWFTAGHELLIDPIWAAVGTPGDVAASDSELRLGYSVVTPEVEWTPADLTEFLKLVEVWLSEAGPHESAGATLTRHAIRSTPRISRFGTVLDTPEFVSTELVTFPSYPAPVVLMFTVRAEALALVSDGEWALREMLYRTAALANPAHGEIFVGPPARYATAREYALGQRPPETVPRARQMLRSFDWVTIVPAELAERLPDLKESGVGNVPVEVDRLPSGALWLRATEHLDQYDTDAKQRLNRLLGPLTAWPAFVFDPPWMPPN